MTPHVADIWDRLIMLPIIISIFLAASCAVHVLASPRVFLNPLRRWFVAAWLAIYIILMLIEAPRIDYGMWYVDGLTFMRWCIQLVPWIISFWLMAKLERVNTDRPMRGAAWQAPEAWPSDSKIAS